MKEKIGLVDKYAVAEFLAIKPSTVDHHRRTGLLPAIKIGRAYRFRWVDVESVFTPPQPSPRDRSRVLETLRPVPRTRRAVA